MRKEELLDYHQKQIDMIKLNRDSLQAQGYVKGYYDVYPDVYNRINSKKSIAYIRGNVSVKLMALLYDVVIVYIPPLLKKQLEERFFLKDWSELIQLCQQGIVIPIIGKAEHYTASHFNDLFKNLTSGPYSLWARGLGLLDVFGMSNTLEIAHDVLPIDAIANDDKVFKKWSKRYQRKDEDFIRKRIKDDVAVQYADLCIFGCKNELEAYKSLSPRDLYEKMSLLNEIRTYPVLFGLESQPNYEDKKLAGLSTMHIQPQLYIPQALPKNDLEILYNGIGIDVDEISVKDIISYHKDGLGKVLRAALSSFNDYCDEKINKSQQIDLTQVYARAEAFQNQLRVAINDLNDNEYYKRLDKTEKTIEKFLKIGTITIGAIIATDPNTSKEVSIVSSAGSLATAFISNFPQSISNVLTKLISRGIYSKFVANMWTARRIAMNK